MMRLENAPRPPVGRALVNEMIVTPQTVGSARASSEAERVRDDKTTFPNYSQTWYICTSGQSEVAGIEFRVRRTLNSLF